MSFTKPALWLSLLSITAACSAFAQHRAAPAEPAPQQVAPFRSALDGYRPFADQAVTPWRESNEAVRNAGGWRAYAREAQEGTQPSAKPAAPAASTPQGGHKH
jgi:hypothetical protein